MTPDKTHSEALAQLRHLYANLTNGGVRDTASAKRIAEGLLSPAIAALERRGSPVVAGEPEGWITWWPTAAGVRDPIYSHGPKKPSHGAELDARLRKYPVYNTPQPTQAQAGAVPLADYKAYALIDSMGWSLDDQEKDDMLRLLRATEAAHGIKEGG